MKQDEIKIGEKYIFINNGNREDKKQFHYSECVVLKIKRGKRNENAFYRNKRAKKPDRFLLDIGIYANAANLTLNKQ